MTDRVTYAYPCAVKDMGDGEFLVVFPDWPEALTSGSDEDDALAQAADALEEAAASRIAAGEGLPLPSPRSRDQHLIPLPAEMALRGLIAGWAEQHGRGGYTALAKALGKDERHARRLLDPTQSTAYATLCEAARAIGLVPSASIVWTSPRRMLRTPSQTPSESASPVETAIQA